MPFTFFVHENKTLFGPQVFRVKYSDRPIWRPTRLDLDLTVIDNVINNVINNRVVFSGLRHRGFYREVSSDAAAKRDRLNLGSASLFRIGQRY